MKDLIEKIKECQKRYMLCFCIFTEDEHFIRYSDPKLPDMYEYNALFPKKDLPGPLLDKLCREELRRRRQENITFFKVTMDQKPRSTFEMFDHKPSVERYGTYVLRSDTNDWRINEACTLEKVANATMIEELTALDIIQSGESAGVDFCIRRAHRRGEVYLSDAPCDCYLCRIDGKAVGNVDLLIHDGTAKIEDFAVDPAYQHRKIGTAMLKMLIAKAHAAGCETVYLVADEDDTPKAMYTMLGFEKVRETYALFWKSESEETH
jgi:spore maturation protein CgeE